MSKFGLSLAGGGGLGSYQIGVWKALREYEIDKRIDALSGTSVGILNACLIAQNDYDIAEYIWKNEIENNILSKKKMSMKNNSISSNGIFTREGLLEIMDKYLDLDIVIKDGMVESYNPGDAHRLFLSGGHWRQPAHTTGHQHSLYRQRHTICRTAQNALGQCHFVPPEHGQAGWRTEHDAWLALCDADDSADFRGIWIA